MAKIIIYKPRKTKLMRQAVERYLNYKIIKHN